MVYHTTYQVYFVYEPVWNCFGWSETSCLDDDNNNKQAMIPVDLAFTSLFFAYD